MKTVSRTAHVHASPQVIFDLVSDLRHALDTVA